MSQEEQNILNNNIDPEFEKFLEATSNLVVPPSKQGKEAAWDKLMQAIDQEDVKEVKVVKLSYPKIWYSIAAVIIVFFTIASLTYRFAQVKVESIKGIVSFAALPDGSQINLNADSRIGYRKFGWLSKREVELNGEAYFKVNKGSKFTVFAGDGRKVTVTGTEFNVFTRGSQFEVKCFDGSVVVETSKIKPVIVTKGEGISVIESEVTPIQFDVDSIATPTWINGEFFFSNTMLCEVFDEINRQFNVTVTFVGFDPKSRKYTGYFNRNKLNQALDLVCLPMGLTYSISADSTKVDITSEKK